VRIGRDIHDGAQQQLVAIQIRLALALERVDEPELAGELETIADDAAAALEQLRKLAHGVYPPVLLHSGLGPALAKAAQDAPIRVAVQDHSSARFPTEIEVAIYFCTLEALQNAAKHAGTGAGVTISLEPHRGGIAFTIADDGAGFDTSVQSTGTGRLSMHDRVEALGGDLHIVSALGRGTTVHGFVPVPGAGAGTG